MAEVKAAKNPISESADAKILNDSYQYLLTMQSQPAKVVNAEQLKAVKHEDFFFLKNNSNEWKQFWGVLQGDKLVYYKNKRDPASRGSLEVSFVTAKIITDADTLARKQAENDSTKICKYRVSLYTPVASYVFSGEVDANVEAWLKAIQTLLGLKFSPEELEAKTKAAEHLEPLVEQQREIQKEQYNSLIKTLQSTGLFWKKPAKTLKEGYIKIREEDANRTWRQYYVRLYKDHISYYKLDNKSVPEGIVSMSFIMQVGPATSADTCRTIKIVTALRTYNLKTKHEVAMKDWLTAITSAKQGKPVDKTDSQETILHEIVSDIDLPADQSVYEGVLKLTWTDDDGNNMYKAKKLKKVTLGRSSNSEVKISDSRLSRNHCCIEFKGRVPIILDLGSSHGTKVNGTKVSKQVLKPGDTIKIGDTSINVQFSKK